MIEAYTINKKQLTSPDYQNAALILVSSATKNDEEKICTGLKLNDYIFEKHNSAAEVSYFQELESSSLVNAQLLTTFSLQNKYEQIESALTPFIAIFNQEKLILISTNNLASIKKFFQSTEKFSPIQFLIKCLLIQNNKFNSKLKLIKKEIDMLDKNARQTTKTSELIHLTDLTRELVYLEQTIIDQSSTIEKFINYLLTNQLASSSITSRLETSQLRLRKTIKIYRDLLDSISSLFSSIMDSHLNNLMKYLDTIAILISIPALISGIWGMNVGGLPGKDQDFGFWIVIILSVIIVIISAIFLNRKKYLDN